MVAWHRLELNIQTLTHHLLLCLGYSFCVFMYLCVCLYVYHVEEVPEIGNILALMSQT